ncbi:hypothetical protein DIS24_g3596 [Lasiodiplodia hormozganensis]|uniref:Uncharacterized protein n=1 Tax=Lasiodiplodia hormozganensis TaxID=869390 RepID=A0AA40D4F9_9PEZI|nr:uncharacterized protein LTHEOB_9236 [Lasiodiplodia theobromae]KAF4540565.1 hypothetical protein LTHEOB_9236 [Lasiodiplodia theobromae]KAK0659914.1 hypothetical protein DIS24_g3596 [Lasiodiplodia hormozganensis]
MDVFYAYTFGTAAWLALQATPMIASPTMIAALLSPQVREATTLEIYFSRSLGFSLITLGILTVLLTGSVPLSSRLSSPAGGATTDPNDPKAPYALPTLTVTTLYHAAAAFYMYGMWTETNVTSFSLGVAGSTSLAAVGLWCILFASSDGRISRKTGADKRTSGWPFKNAEADRRKARKSR